MPEIAKLEDRDKMIRGGSYGPMSLANWYVLDSASNSVSYNREESDCEINLEVIFSMTQVCVCVYHTYIHTYMHTCIHAYMHTCIHAYIHGYTNVDPSEGR